MTLTRKEVKDVVLSLRLPASLRERLRKAGKKYDRPPSDVARILIEQGLEREGF